MPTLAKLISEVIKIMRKSKHEMTTNDIAKNLNLHRETIKEHLEKLEVIDGDHEREMKDLEDTWNQKLKELVLAKLDSYPSDRKMSIGSKGEFTKAQLIKSVEAEDDIGKQIMEMELEFLKAISRGDFYRDINLSN